MTVHYKEQHTTDQTDFTKSQIFHKEHYALVTQDVFLIWLLNNKCSISNVQGRNKVEDNNSKERSHYSDTKKYTGCK